MRPIEIHFPFVDKNVWLIDDVENVLSVMRGPDKDIPTFGLTFKTIGTAIIRNYVVDWCYGVSYKPTQLKKLLTKFLASKTPQEYFYKNYYEYVELHYRTHIVDAIYTLQKLAFKNGFETDHDYLSIIKKLMPIVNLNVKDLKERLTKDFTEVVEFVENNHLICEKLYSYGPFGIFRCD